MSLRRFSFLLVPTCAAWLGCAGGEPGTLEPLSGSPSPVDTQPVDTQPVDTDGEAATGEPLKPGCTDTDGGTPSGDSVWVTNTTRFYTAVGKAERVNALSAEEMELLIPDGVTFIRKSGTAVDGGVVFSGVPSGTTYYLRPSTSSRSFHVSDSRHIDLGSNRLGRPDAVRAPGIYGTPLQLNLVGLEPWAPWQGTTLPGTALQLASAQVDIYGDVSLWEDVPPGQNFLITNQAELFTYSEMPIFESQKGDRLYVNQLGPQDAGTLPDGGALAYNTVVRSVEVGTFDFAADGFTPLPLSGVMQPVRRTEFPMEWRLPEYTRRAAEVHPAATPSTPFFAVIPAAHGLEDGWIGYSGELLTLTLPRGASYDFTRRLTYGNPYPSSWGVVGQVLYNFRVTAVPPGASNTVIQSGSMVTYDRLDHLVAGPIVPRITPPRGLTIDGVDAYVTRQVGSASPVIAWQPPLVGTPEAYRVTLYRYEPGQFVAPIYSRFYVSGSTTQLRLPPEALAPGRAHYVRVTAIDAPGYEVTRLPFLSAERLPISNADTLSAWFTTP